MDFEDFGYGHDFDSPSGSSARRPLPPAIPPQFWGPPTSSDRSSSNSTIVPYHGLSPDNFYQDTPSPPPPLSPSPQVPDATVLPWVPSPPQHFSPPAHYAIEQVLGPELIRPPPSTRRNPSTRSRPAQNVRFDEAQIAMTTAGSAERPELPRRELSQSSGGQLTPGLDDTSFIQYALDALTRQDGMPLTESLSSDRSSHQDPVGRATRAPEPQPAEQQPASAMPYNPLGLSAFQAETPSVSSEEFNYAPATRGKPKLSSPMKRVAVSYADVERSQGTGLGGKHGALDYKPTILRLPSFIILMVLCTLMIGGLVFCAVYSRQQTGLLLYPGTLNTGHYFLFRIFPQILGAALFLYAQALITTTLRVLPFERMYNDDPDQRRGAIFLDLYPSSYLWPHCIGPWPVKICIFVTWLLNFSLPLLSTLFGVVYVQGKWTWATVQGVAWALVALYLVYLAALGLLSWFWLGRDTGMLWDVRSIADMVPMLHHSDTRASYKGTHVLATRRQLKERLQDRMVDRLGYWRSERITAAPEDTHVGHYWWGVGTAGEDGQHAGDDVPRSMKPERNSAMSDPEALAPDAHHHYLPWWMRNVQILSLSATGFSVFIALLVVSFHPDTSLTRGFSPEVAARPDRHGFSPANFLYSFIPSLLGQILFLVFQSLESTYRQVMPWGELSTPGGSPARRSILLDYAAACHPLQTVYKAARNGHRRLAFISLLSALFIFLPILGGGLFMAMTISGTAEVRMFPSVPVYGVVLALLGLFVCGSVAMIPARGRYGLPHAVGCLAEVFSFVANDDIAGADHAFRFPRDRKDMLARLGVGAEAAETRWWFGVAPGRDEVVGVRRARRFTERGVASAGEGPVALG